MHFLHDFIKTYYLKNIGPSRKEIRNHFNVIIEVGVKILKKKKKSKQCKSKYINIKRELRKGESWPTPNHTRVTTKVIKMSQRFEDFLQDD